MELSARSQRKVNTIIEQASRLFVRQGYHHVTMEGIAQYANVSKVTLYKYFKDKQSLYEHILLLDSDKDFQSVKSIIADFIPYPEKVRSLLQLELDNYHDMDRPNVDPEIILTLDTEKALKKHETRLKKQRQKLYNQGRMEEFICENITDAILENYYFTILNGLIKQYKHIQKLSEEDQLQVLNLLCQGILKCHE